MFPSHPHRAPHPVEQSPAKRSENPRHGEERHQGSLSAFAFQPAPDACCFFPTPHGAYTSSGSPTRSPLTALRLPTTPRCPLHVHHPRSPFPGGRIAGSEPSGGRDGRRTRSAEAVRARAMREKLRTHLPTRSIPDRGRRSTTPLAAESSSARGQAHEKARKREKEREGKGWRRREKKCSAEEQRRQH